VRWTTLHQLGGGEHIYSCRCRNLLLLHVYARLWMWRFMKNYNDIDSSNFAVTSAQHLDILIHPLTAAPPPFAEHVTIISCTHARTGLFSGFPKVPAPLWNSPPSPTIPQHDAHPLSDSLLGTASWLSLMSRKKGSRSGCLVWTKQRCAFVLRLSLVCSDGWILSFRYCSVMSTAANSCS